MEKGMGDDCIKRRRLLRRGIHHALKLGPAIIGRRCAERHKLGDDFDPLCLAIGPKLATLVVNGQVVFGLASGRNPEIEGDTPWRCQGGVRFGLLLWRSATKCARRRYRPAA